MAGQNKNILPDIGDIVFLFVLILVVFVRPHYLFTDGSTGWHLVTGQYILQNLSVPTHDLISYTFADKAWVAYEWLSDVIFALLAKFGGLALVNVFVGSLIAFLFLRLYADCRKTGCNFALAALVTMLGILASSIHWIARPHIFTFWGLYIFARTLEAYRQGTISDRRLHITLAITMLFWVNLHPAFLLGFVLVIIYLATEILGALMYGDGSMRQEHAARAKTYVVAVVFSGLATLINPYGLKLYEYIAKYFHGSQQIIAATEEFKSPVFQGGLQSSCLEILFLLLVLGLVLSKRRPALAPFLASLAFAHLALSYLRGAPLFVIVALPFIAGLFAVASLIGNEAPSSWVAKVKERWYAINSSFDQTEAACQMHLVPMLVVLVLAVATIAGPAAGGIVPQTGFDPVTLPSKTLEYIRDNKLPANAGFNFDNWGGLIRYQLGMPVFIDERADFYGEPFYLEYAKVSLVTPEWSNVLDKHQINWILFPKNSKLAERLKQSESWRLQCEDPAAVLFVRVANR